MTRPNISSLQAGAEDLQECLNRIYAHCQEFKAPDVSRSVRQVSLSLLLYGLICAASIYAVRSGNGWALILTMVPAAGLLVKLFTIQHDCGHGSYFKAKWANDAVGRLISILTMTPYAFWRDAHNKHHASSGNLSKRGIGGIDTITVEEFKSLPRHKQMIYKIYRHPCVILLFGPPLHTILLQRLPLTGLMPFMNEYHTIKGPHLMRSVMALNLAIVIFYGALIWKFGFAAIVLTFLPILFLAACIGGWLFYVQHQYEETYWAESKSWDYKTAALLGSSHYDLPKILQWFTGNIGFHHIHHLVSQIPNYRLPECYRQSPDLQKFPRLTFVESLKSARLRLWDERAGKMVTF